MAAIALSLSVAGLLFTAAPAGAADANLQIDLGGRGFNAALSPDGNRLYATSWAPNDAAGNSQPGAIKVIDTATNTISASILVGKNPAVLALNTSGSKLCVPNNDSGSVSVIDTAKNSVTATVDIGGHPITALVTPNGKSVFVSNTHGGDVVVVPNWTSPMTTVLNGRSYARIAEVNIGTKQTTAAITSNGHFAWVGNQENQSVVQVDLTKAVKGKVTVGHKVATGADPFHLLLNANNSALYVANRQAQSISVICTKPGTVAQTIPLGGRPQMLVGGPSLYAIEEERFVEVIPASLAGQSSCG